MKKVELQIEDYLYEFYRKVGESAGGLSLKVGKEKKTKKE